MQAAHRVILWSLSERSGAREQTDRKFIYPPTGLCIKRAPICFNGGRRKTSRRSDWATARLSVAESKENSRSCSQLAKLELWLPAGLAGCTATFPKCYRNATNETQLAAPETLLRLFTSRMATSSHSGESKVAKCQLSTFSFRSSHQMR